MSSARPITAKIDGIDGLLLFDAECPFCRRSVRWFLARERGDSHVAIAGLKTSVGERLGRHFAFDPGDGDSIRYIAAGRCHRDSEALWRLGERLAGGWRHVSRLQFVPRPVRDEVYQLVGRHRSRLAPSDDARLEGHERWCARLTPVLCERLGLPASLAEAP